MNASVSCLAAPMVQGISDARDTVKHAVESCWKKGQRVITQSGEGVERKTQQFKTEHPVATHNLKTFGDYVIKAGKATRDGIKTTAKRAVSINNRVTETVKWAKRHVETHYPKAAIAIKSISEFALNPITYALKGTGIGISALILLTFTPLMPLIASEAPLILGGLAVGAGYGLAKAALNSARYTLKLEGAEQHPYLEKAVSLCDRVLSPIKKADRFLEGLHPALSIPYKVVKECTVAAVNIPAIWCGGVLGIEVLNKAVNLSDNTTRSAVEMIIPGGVALGVVKPVWDTGKFAYRRIREHVWPEESQPVLRFNDESKLASYVTGVATRQSG